MKKVTFFILFIYQLQYIYSQDSIKKQSSFSNVNIGFGIGIDYGGIGCRATLLQSKMIGLFAYGGSNTQKGNIGGGIVLRLAPKDRLFCPFIAGIYGYNAVIKTKGSNKCYNKSYYGYSISYGFEIHFKKLRKNYLCFELLIPFRNQKFKNDLEYLRNRSSIKIESEDWPIVGSFGYHFGL